MFSGFEKEDKIQAAMLYFGMWLEENNIKLPQRVPMSLINSKYGQKIRESLHLSNYANLETIGKTVLDKGLVVLDTLQPEEKFTEKNQRLIDKLIPKDLPIGSTLTIREDDPNELFINVNIPFGELIKSNLSVNDLDNLKRTPNLVREKMIKLLGIEEGNTLHGDFQIYRGHTYSGIDEWEKKFAKQIKPEIRSVEGGNRIRAIKIEIKQRVELPIKITIYFKGGYFSERYNLRNKIFEMLRDKFGYNTDLISIAV